MIAPTLVIHPPSDHPEKTVVILGAYRGGTSMAAAAVHAFGVPLGCGHDGGPPDPYPLYEDPEFRWAFLDRNFTRLHELIGDRNREFAFWGFKWPGIARDAVLVENWLRRPHYVVVLRDAAAVAVRELDRGLIRGDQRELLRYSFEQQELLARFVDRCRRPLLVVSYERAVRQADEFAHALAAFLSLPTSDKTALSRVAERIRRE